MVMSFKKFCEGIMVGDISNPQSTQTPILRQKVKAKKQSVAIKSENFIDGKNPQDKGDSARHGIKKGSSISDLKKIRSSDTASPRKKQLAHWQINMRQGKKKKSG
tara:strand:- start:942 stop:1256 length:315 start_codon:yes stop_codon:yes gene_type:complete